MGCRRIYFALWWYQKWLKRMDFWRYAPPLHPATLTLNYEVLTSLTWPTTLAYLLHSIRFFSIVGLKRWGMVFIASRFLRSAKLSIWYVVEEIFFRILLVLSLGGWNENLMVFRYGPNESIEKTSNLWL